MTEKIMTHLNVLVERYPALESIKAELLEAYEIMETCYANGGKLLATAVLLQMQNT